MIITIPCFNEPDLLRTLNSLRQCNTPQSGAEVIVHVNASEKSSDEIQKQNEKTIDEFIIWNEDQNSTKLKFHLIYSPSLPKKHAGVGLARKNCNG